MPAKRTILVSGMIGADPGQGGATWAVLQYVLGLRRLGHEVYLVEPISAKALRPAGRGLANSENAKYFTKVVTEFDLIDRSALVAEGAKETCGLSYDRLETIARQADALINISGMLTDENLLKSIPIRVYLDLDPAFNQLWNKVEGVNMRFAGHTHFVTIGLGIGEPGCPVPTCGLKWLKTLQPIVLEHWESAGRFTYDAFTTVGNWRGYGSIEHDGMHFGQKAHSLRRFFDLPAQTHESFLLALSIHPDETRDLSALAKNGWCLIDPAKVAGSPYAYREFIQASKAEFGIAKSGYVVSRCGWFSDRSVCYLASGRPVVAQETGFSRHLPTGEGLFAFTNTEDVVQAAETVRADYKKQAARARSLAEEYFDSARVLPKLLQQIGA
jgi:hypothetical protein